MRSSFSFLLGFFILRKRNNEMILIYFIFNLVFSLNVSQTDCDVTITVPDGETAKIKNRKFTQELHQRENFFQISYLGSARYISEYLPWIEPGSLKILSNGEKYKIDVEKINKLRKCIFDRPVMPYLLVHAKNPTSGMLKSEKRSHFIF